MHGLLVTLGWIVVVSAIACVAMFSALQAFTEPFFGLGEGIFYVAMIVWFLIVAAQLV